ncbi:HflC protein [Methylophaga frappieri]|uniref:Protein HflC n=1 Tax=Methylophaga frappieri (strain ATCC BAA-2434 / DSM 25690 / JAM7) TaxID=754477 RepID=I1YKW7_METFJ|nr:protease modulator HflC [Methylophaga frappieri]AFJ03560.1 HflC protein [Methylophaga frappieri]
MQSRLTLYVFTAVVILVLLSASVFFVDEREKVILLKLGQIERSDYEPGLHFKMPFVNQVRRFDGRILSLDAQPARYLTGEKKNVIVDSFILWRIEDVAQYFRAMSGDEENARLRLSQIIKDGLRAEFGRRTIQEVVSGDREQMVAELMQEANETASEFGIEILNVRIKRIDLPSEVSESVFARMQAERERVAKDLRSRGAEEAEKIRSDADRQRTVLLAEARRQAENLRGDGDAQATEIYADAYSQDESFYALYRRLNAYQNIFQGEDLLVIEPTGDFFNRFSSESALTR